MIMVNPDMLPPGFRFHPKDEELILHYLRNRAANAPCPVAIIADVDIYKFDPWDLPSRAAYGDKEWYFFSPRERKYPNGIRPNRAAGSGYWKATGTDKPIHSSATGEGVGVKKALVFYKGRPPKGTKTNWIMHEYRLAADAHAAHAYRPMKFRNASMRLDDWVLCRIYKKTSHVPAMAVPPLSNHEQDELCGGGFDDNPYAATSAAMLLQHGAYPALHAAAGGAPPQRMPRIPSLSELFNDPSLAHYFEPDGGVQVPDMARPPAGDQHAPLLGHPVTSQLLVNNGSSLSGGQQIPQVDSSAAGKRKRSSETGAGAGALSSQASALCSQETERLLFWCNVPNRQRTAGSLAHQMLLHSNMGMN